MSEQEHLATAAKRRRLDGAPELDSLRSVLNRIKVQTDPVELLTRFEQRLLALKEQAPTRTVATTYEFLQDVVVGLNEIGRKIQESPAAEGSLKPHLDHFVEQLIAADVYFKVDHPEKLPMWLDHGYAMRPTDLDIPHQGGLVDAVLVANDFCVILLHSCIGHLPLSFFHPLIKHLKQYYQNLLVQPHAALPCIAGEIADLRKFSCACDACLAICNFFAKDHGQQTLEILGDEDQIRHVWEKKINPKLNLHIKDFVQPKALATALKRKKWTFDKAGGYGAASSKIMLHRLAQFKL